MQVVSVILYVDKTKTEEFEREFAEYEYPVWEDLVAKGKMVRASLQRCEIESVRVKGAQEYMVVAVFPGEDHEAHDSHPEFQKWNERAERFQVAEPLAFGGAPMFSIG